MLAKMCRNWNPGHCWWESKMEQPLKSSMMVPQKIENRITLGSNYPSSGYRPPKLKAGSFLKRYLHTRVNSIIYNSQKVGRNLRVHQQMNRLAKCGIYIQ